MSRKLPLGLQSMPKTPQLEMSCTIEYLYTPHEITAACEQLLQSGVDFVGFDVEWKVNFVRGQGPRPIALMQLCFEAPCQKYLQSLGGLTGDPDAVLQELPYNADQRGSLTGEGRHTKKKCKRFETSATKFDLHVENIRKRKYHCLLLHISKAGFPEALRGIIENPHITKAGIGIRGDSSKLHLDYKCSLKNTFDINDELNARQDPTGLVKVEYTTFKLSDLTARLLSRTLAKPTSLRCSNWEAWPLNSEQQRYAALDALASLQCALAVKILTPLEQPLKRPKFDPNENIDV